MSHACSYTKQKESHLTVLGDDR